MDTDGKNVPRPAIRTFSISHPATNNFQSAIHPKTGLTNPTSSK